jgi:hypothetical protein
MLFKVHEAFRFVAIANMTRRRSIERVPEILMLANPTIFWTIRPPRNSHGLIDEMSEALPEFRSFFLPAGVPHRTPL